MAATFEIFIQFSLTSILAGTVSLVIWFYWTNRKILAEARKLPTGRRTIPLLGHTYFLIHGIVEMANMVMTMVMDSAAQSINTIVLWVGPYPLFIISDPRDIQTLFNSSKSLDGGLEHDLLKYALGNSLPLAPGSIWKGRRRSMNPMFHPRNLEYLLPRLNECARDLTASLSRHVGRGQVDVGKEVYTVALKAVYSLVFGPEIHINAQEEPFQKVIQAIDSISSLAADRLFRIWLWPEFMFRTFYKKEVKKIISSGKNLVEAEIKLAKMKRNQKDTTLLPEGNNSGSNNNEGNPKNLTIMDIYDVIRAATPEYNEEDLYHEIITALAAGVETSKVTMMSCLLALAINPDIQEKLYTEIVSVIGREESDLTIENVNSMQYLDQVIKETLRRFIITPILSRRTQDTLKLNSCTLPPGAMACVTNFAVHMNPKYYPEPHIFDPDRFSPENTAQKSSYCFIPFSAGPKSCIGKNYAMTTMKILLSHVIRKYKFTTTKDITRITYLPGAIAKRVDGYDMTVQHRH